MASGRRKYRIALISVILDLGITTLPTIYTYFLIKKINTITLPLVIPQTNQLRSTKMKS